MNRRHFLSGLTALTGAALAKAAPAARPPFTLSAYYLRAHMYTLVPRHVREDLDWMRGHGTQNVCLAVLEQDFTAARENIDFIIAEAQKRSMQAFAIPSRWGGLVAGAPKVPSLFSVQNPETWALDKDGEPRKSGVSGVLSSIYHPATLDFMTAKATEMLKLWPFAGLIWDEPKCYDQADHHPMAVKQLGTPTWEGNALAVSDFFGKVNQTIKAQNPKCQIVQFIYAQSHQTVIDAAASTPGQDAFGCDGRPWGPNEGKHLEGEGKTLIDKLPKFINAAKAKSLSSFALIENHNLATEDIDLMDRRLPEVFTLKADHYAYYYYPRNVKEPERAMGVISRRLKEVLR